METVRNLNLKIYKDKLAVPYRIWLLLRKLDVDGKGYVRYDEFMQYLELLEMDRFTFYNAKKYKEAELFFTYDKKEKIILYRSMLNVCNALNVIIGTVVDIPENISDINTFKAYLHSSIMSNKGTVISRDRIKERFNVSKNTQRHYEELANIQVEANSASIFIPKEIRNNIEKIKEFIKTKLPIDPNRVDIKISNGAIYWTIPNTYKAISTTRKYKKHWASKKQNQEGSNILGSRATSYRLFYDNSSAFNYKYFTSEHPSYISTGRKVKSIRGQQSNLFRFNFLSPTKNKHIAEEYAQINSDYIIKSWSEKEYLADKNTLTSQIITLQISDIELNAIKNDLAKYELLIEKYNNLDPILQSCLINPIHKYNELYEQYKQFV